nr:MAG TPA: hypothetical protein [Caudoviricetes sp.]
MSECPSCRATTLMSVPALIANVPNVWRRLRGASADTRTANCRACSTKSACLWCSPPPTTRINQNTAALRGGFPVRRCNVLQNFLAGFGGVGGACALITLGLKLWPGALDALATGLYAHVRPERLPYDSPLSQHFAKTRQLGERTAKFDERMDELCRDTIKNTIISLIYGDQSHDHSEAVRYELAKLEKLDAQCWIVNAAEKYLEDRQ